MEQPQNKRNPIKPVPGEAVHGYRLLCVAFFLFGFTFGMPGAVLPRMIQTFKWDYSVAGLILVSCFLGYLLATLAGGLLVSRIGQKHLTLYSLLVQAFGLGLVVFSRSPLSLGALLFLAGVGQGGVEIAANTYVIHFVEPEGEGRWMNLLHALFGVGAIAGPVVTAFMLSLSPGYSSPFLLASVLSLGLLLWMSRVPFPLAQGPESAQTGIGEPNSAAVDSSAFAGVRSLLPVLALPILAIFLYTGLETAVSGWVPEFTVQVIRFPEVLAPLGTGFLWVGLLSGRLFLAAMGGRISLPARLLVLSGWSALFLVMALFTTKAVPILVIFVLVGLGFSGLYPAIMTMAVLSVPQRYRNATTGIIACFGGVGTVVLPALTGFVADARSLRGGFAVLSLAGISLFVLLVIGSIRRRARIH